MRTHEVQKYLVLKELEKHPVTSIEMIDKYRITRLSAIIKLLRNDGYVIKTTMVYNGRSRYGVYKLNKVKSFISRAFKKL